MIFGVFSRNEHSIVDPQAVERALDACPHLVGNAHVLPWSRGVFGYRSPFRTKCYQELQPAVSRDRQCALVFVGRLYNEEELRQNMARDGADVAHTTVTEFLLTLYARFGSDFLKHLQGKFALALWDETRQTVLLSRDRFGIEPLYYYLDSKHLVFSSSTKSILDYTQKSGTLDHATLARYALFNFNPGLNTIYEDIIKLRPAHYMHVGLKTLNTEKYWNLSFKTRHVDSEEQIADELLGHLRNAVVSRLDPEAGPGIFVSGGMDSSTILGLTNETVTSPLRTYSYRCQSESFDESHYARRMAEFANTTHQELVYGPGDVSLMRDIVRTMNEPFCDVGINIATHLLGRSASSSDTYVLTGDGGDELFGGHPIYEADKIAKYVEVLPLFVRQSLNRVLSFIPDSDKKKPLSVKLKRFIESSLLSPDLLSHRWRIYYQFSELQQLFVPEVAGKFQESQVYQDIFDFNAEGDGEDDLSRSLYSDYQTIIDFYLRRNDLNRCFSLETRYPLFDHRLVEFCASLPTDLKIRGWFDTKYIFKKAMENVLPHEIVHRQDKLGHSIPLKNWMRDDSQVQAFVMNYLNEGVIKKRGIFNPKFVQQLVDEHMAKQRNNSHRLWGLAVFEMWMQEHGDGKTT